MTIAASALICLTSEKKEEDNKSEDIAQNDVKSTLSQAINQYSVVGNNNANLVKIPMSALIDLSGKRKKRTKAEILHKLTSTH